MPISKTSPYDVIIVGAGINGCASAYYLARGGLRVALIDQTSIAAGGSGAAGAFIAPKISKSGPLKEIVDKAHAHAMTFYPEYFPDSTLIRPLLHVAKTPHDADKLQVYKRHTDLKHSEPPESLTSRLNTSAEADNSIYFERSAVVNAQEVCLKMSEGIDFFVLKVEKIAREGEWWNVEGIRAKEVVLAIGAYPKIVAAPYLQMRGIWGHRIDIRTSDRLPCILHHYVSISPTSEEGVMAIGATHDVHYRPFDALEPYDIKAGRAELLEKAQKTLLLNNIEIIRDYTGLRSGSNDYLPILGPLIDAEATFQKHPKLREASAVVDPGQYVYYPGLTMINGSGGYGFVLAPYLAEMLSDHLINGRAIDTQLLPERFFTRWIKKGQAERITAD